MDFKRLAFSGQLPYCSTPPRRRKVVSGFGLGLVASLIIFSVVLFDVSFKPRFFDPVSQGLRNFGSRNTTSIFLWSLSFSSTCFSSSCRNASSVDNNGTKKLEDSVTMRERYEGNVPKNGKIKKYGDSGRMEAALKDAHLGNFSEMVNNGNFSLEERRVPEKALGSEIGKNASFKHANGLGVVLEDKKKGNFSKNVKNGNVTAEGRVPKGKGITGEGKGPNSNKDFSHKYVEPRKSSDNRSEEEKSLQINDERNSQVVTAPNSSYRDCDIFHGRWVRDDSKPYYPPGSCPYIDRDFDCYLNKRPDYEFVKWKWQPYGCDIPILNATNFLTRLRGQKLVFVGDSLNRNMWESLVCILRQSLPDKKRVYEISGRTEFKKKDFYAFRFEDYNCSVDFVSSPFLVRESYFKVVNGFFETLRLDLMDQTTSMYQDADILIFNTAHWWTHEKTSRGEDYYQEGNHVHRRLKVLEAYKRAITTWARWIDKNINGERTHVIFRGYSGVHFSGGQWNSGGQCHKETEPIFNETYLEKYPSKMRLLEYVLRKMRNPVIYLNISRLSDYRKDGHPSIYRKEYKTLEEQITGEQAQDCSHWCLPGVPDTWNELLYASLLKTGRGSWRN